MKRKFNEQNQQQIRKQLESTYREKLKAMNQMFQVRYKTLQDSIRLVFDRIKGDQVLSTMFNDKTTRLHLQDRVKEIFSQVVAEQRQLIFKKLMTQIINYRSQNEQLSRKLQKLEDSNNHLEKQFCTERLTFQQTRNNVNEELKKIKEEGQIMIKEQEKKHKQIEILKAKLDKMNSIERQNYQLNDLATNLKGEYDNLFKQNNQLKDLQNTLDRKYKNKKKQYQQKIEEYKSLINQLRNKNRSQFLRNEETLDDKIGVLLKENEIKFSQLKKNHEKEKLQLQKRYDKKLKQTQNYFQKILQAKMIQIEENTALFYEKMKEQGHHFQKTIQYYQENFISLEQFEDEIGKRQQLMIAMKKKLQQFQEVSKNYVVNKNNFTKKMKQMEQSCSLFKQKCLELEELNREITNKYISYEQSNSIFKINEKKVKEQFEDYEKIVKKLKQENEEIKNKCYCLQDAKYQINNTIRQQERKIKQNNQQIQNLITNKKKKDEILDRISKQKEQLVQNIMNLKKQKTSLQYKIKDQQLTINLSNNKLQSTILKIKQQLQQKNSMMTELQQRYHKINFLYEEERNKNTSMEKMLKKYEIQNNSYRQFGDLYKTQQQNAIQGLKSLIVQKNIKIQQLEQQVSQKNQHIKVIQQEKKTSIQYLNRFNQKLKSKIDRIIKIIIAQLHTLKKQGLLIKDHLKSRQIIHNNEEVMYFSAFNKEIIHYQIYYEKQKDNEIKKIKQEMRIQHSNDTKLIKSQCQQRIQSIIDKSQYQKNLIKHELKEKEQNISKMTHQIKMVHLQARKEKEQCKTKQKQLQQANSRFQQLKESYECKLRNLTKEMKQEKQDILKEYEDKRGELQQQVLQLSHTIKQLQTQIQLIIAKHEEQKLVINSQLRTVKQQQEAVQKIVHQKSIQMQKCWKNYQSLQQTKKKLENQQRSYANTLNQKIQLIHQLQLKKDQLNGELNLIKNRCDRFYEENCQIKRKLSQKEEQYQQSIKIRSKMEIQLKDIKGALNRSTKNHELRSLNELSMQTLQLSQKVNQMRKFNNILDSKTKTPLRS